MDALRWMKDALRFEADDYTDCGEVDCTRLAEAAADALNLCDEDGNIPDDVFDAAVEVAAWWDSL